MSITARELLTQQIERIFEIAGGYVLAGAHDESEDYDEKAQADRISAVMHEIGFDDNDVLDVAALVAAKTLVSFYGTVRLTLGDLELVDEIWRMFVQLNAAHRASLDAEGS